MQSISVFVLVLDRLWRYVLAKGRYVMNYTEPFVTKKETAQHIRQTPRTVENWMAKGMPHYKLGGRSTRFKLSEVDSFLANQCRVPARP